MAIWAACRAEEGLSTSQQAEVVGDSISVTLRVYFRSSSSKEVQAWEMMMIYSLLLLVVGETPDIVVHQDRLGKIHMVDRRGGETGRLRK